MHASQLIELASLVAIHGEVLVHGSKQIPKAGVEEYWVASKSRLNRWSGDLRNLSYQLDSGSDSSSCPPVDSLLEEILTGEVLTRVWAAAMFAYDRQRDVDFAEPLARSVLIGHMEARHRVLTLLVHGPAIGAEHAVKLNRLRSRTERWIDMLIGCMAELGEVSEFAVDPARAEDFAEGLSASRRRVDGHHSRSLVLASLQAAFSHGLEPVSPNEKLNARIGEAVISCFPTELFDSTGILRSAWLTRLTSYADDAQGMLDDLLSPDPIPTDDTGHSFCNRFSDRSQRFGP